MALHTLQVYYSQWAFLIVAMSISNCRRGEYALHKFAGTLKIGWIGSSVVQTVATRAFKAVDRYAFGKNGRPRFKKQNQFDSVDGKQNTVIRWDEQAKSVTWGGLVMPVILPKEGRKGNDVIQYGLDAPLKYVSVVRRKLNGKNRFYAQLVCEGLPYQKPNNKVGEGRVGLDIGPSTIAVASPDAQTAELKQFANELEPDQKKIRVLQRKLDRQRRANNPQNYEANGTVKKGKKEWNNSKGYEQTRVDLAEINRKLAEYRESLHGRLINHIFSLGNVVNLEKLSYRGFQKMYGRSVGKRAPGKIVSMLKRKAVSAGVSVNEFPTRTTKLSQVCLCGEVKKKPLSERWHICECGVVAQRDLFAAFLAACVEGKQLNADLANSDWRSGMDVCLKVALSEVQPASDGRMPVTFGLSRSQSGSIEKAWKKAGDGRGGVASGTENRQRREPDKACQTPGTSRL